MASNFHRLRRGISLSSSLIHRSLHQPIHVSSHPNLFLSISPEAATAISAPAFPQSARAFTSTTSLFLSDQRKPFNPETDEIGPDTILFEGCDYNHWLITVDFPKDTELTREQKIDLYESCDNMPLHRTWISGLTLAILFCYLLFSVEEAKKKIYALSTTTYEGFQVECSEETSKKFENIPGVVFVLPDSYIDPVNKEYGGDKYVNGEIFPRPPPVHYGRRNYRDRRPRDQMSYQQGNTPYSNQGPSNSEARNYGQNYGPLPQQQNYGPPPPQQQNYGPPPPQQNYGPRPPQQNYGPPQPQNYGPPPLQQNYGLPTQQNYGPPPQQQNYGPPPQQQGHGPLPPPPRGYGPPPQQQNYGRAPPQQGYGHPPQQGYGHPPQQGYAPPQQHNYRQPPNFPPQQSYSPSGPQETGSPTARGNALGGDERNPMPSYQGNLNRGEFGNYNTQVQRDFQQGNMQNHAPPERRGFSQDTNSLPGRTFEQGSGGTQDQSTRINVGPNQPKQGEEPRNFSYTTNN
ncbi:hypothetical protein F511_23536 [Dorcoceras hygrometricum]|uniref:MORF/ORRM1/DAG-like MORF domain-containing protein n=1 Tax=Dorcoceras hygrometricum TaxID=472368 RepID=A0A2Z7CRX2_9LAMI|nr:hypothetical protein F511_23536 [Dorcoceras hygrometricum]